MGETDGIQHEVLLPSGRKGWRARLRYNYDGDYEQFKAYDVIYGLAERLGYESAEEAWYDNPVIQGNTNPADFAKTEQDMQTEEKLREDGFYWVKLKPYEQFDVSYKPDWEVMCYSAELGWQRCGVLPEFKEGEFEEVGPQCGRSDAQLADMIQAAMVDIEEMFDPKDSTFGPFENWSQTSQTDRAYVAWGNLAYHLNAYLEVVKGDD